MRIYKIKFLGKLRQALLVLLILLITTPNIAFATEIKGKYEVIGTIEKLKGVKQIEMMEFFNYSCGHCYQFLKTSKKRSIWAKIFVKPLDMQTRTW